MPRYIGHSIANTAGKVFTNIVDPNISSVELLLDFNGNLTDTSPSGRTVSAAGNAAVSTTQKKFGTHSLALDGTGDYVSAPYSTDWDFGTGDFTIELWYRPDSTVGQQQGLMSCAGSTAQNGWVVGYFQSSNAFYLQFYDQASSTLTQVGTPNFRNYISDNTWAHIAISRQGTAFRTFVDGALVSTTTSSYSPKPSVDGLLKIGAAFANDWSSMYYAKGYIDGARVTKGVARYTSAFTTPTLDYNVTVDNKWNSGVWSISESSGEGYSVNTRRRSAKWTDSRLRETNITGGNKLTPGDGYTYHVFVTSNNTTTTTHNFSVARLAKSTAASANASVMVIAGGGAGGASIGGGAGAGGMLFADNNIVLEDGNYVVIVGAAGVGGPGSSAGGNGDNSHFYHPTTPAPTRALGIGGGGGGTYGVAGPPSPTHVARGQAGGSAGGFGGQHPSQYVGSESTNSNQANPNPSIWTIYGNRGGAGAGGGYSGGGGGGAGGAGVDGSGDRPGKAGGAGQAIPIFPGPGMGLPAIPSNKWAAGGSGIGYPSSVTASTDSIGGKSGGPRPESAGVASSGSGGGALGYNGGAGGSGGSGIIIVRYLTRAD
jgi:hypothetical protein